MRDDGVICSGYDFGYMLKLLTCVRLPPEEQDFFELLKIFFPNIYDVKYLMKSCKNLKGGLQEVADQLEVSATARRSLSDLDYWQHFITPPPWHFITPPP